MTMKLYIGKLAFETSSEDLQELFKQAGTVEAAVVVEDRDVGRARGFGFVEMSTSEESSAAIAQFEGRQFPGRNIIVNEAKPRGGGGRRRGSFGGAGRVRQREDRAPDVDRDEKIGREIEAALKYVESIREVSAADWAEIEQLGAETRRLIAGLKAA